MECHIYTALKHIFVAKHYNCTSSNAASRYFVHQIVAEEAELSCTVVGTRDKSSRSCWIYSASVYCLQVCTKGLSWVCGLFFPVTKVMVPLGSHTDSTLSDPGSTRPWGGAILVALKLGPSPRQRCLHDSVFVLREIK